ncbi:MAG: thiolase domain-containing protein [Chloroflexi bacterium]|nr:thiolase domain-containing protein [Chloroflexota bacterium]MBI5714808.1 thiolase domain-containing protein [Chloroflexota bacterium]
MRKVAILGIGQIPIDEHWEKSIRHLAGDAAIAAIAEAHIEPTAVESLYVGNMLSGALNKQENVSALIADWVGLRGIEASKIEAACGSGAAAFRSGMMAVASGVNDLVLVVGVEKMTETGGTNTTSHLASAADADHEAAHGLSFVALNALIMRRYLHEFGWKHNDFAPFSINAHANGAKNPNARLQEAITQKDYLRARMVADPINLLDASPIGDGAAAILLYPAEKIRRNGQPIITVAASAAATDSIAVHDRFDAMRLAAAETSAQKAYAQANVTPSEIDFFELHDAFSIMAALSLEACGFAERGQGVRLGLENQITPQGRIPVATRGGLKARGHPVGATGVYQLVEVIQQLRGQGGDTQVPGAKIGMAQNIGGSGATVITHILQRE